MRGVNFNNSPAVGIWQAPNPQAINVGEADYAEVGSWGANHVRLGLSYGWYDQSRATFFRVLDQHISWARRHRLWLIPVLYVLPGNCYEGYAKRCPLWGSAGEKRQLVDFWREVARRYANERTVAGYDLLNEPFPPNDAAWYDLAQRVRDAVTSVDRNHFVVVEPTASNVFSHALRGRNVVYAGHFYTPLSLTTSYPGCSYPGQCDGTRWDKRAIEKGIRAGDLVDYRFSVAHDVPLLVDEVGTQKNPGYLRWASDVEGVFDELHLHWTYFVMKESPRPAGPGSSFGLYTCDGVANFSCPDRRLIRIQASHMAGDVRPSG